MQLRPYQSAALSACWDYLRHRDGNPALVLPTGAGKSPLMAGIASEAVQRWGGRVGIIAHVQELVAQNSAKLRAFWPEAPMGIYAAGLRRRDRFDPILFMQIQSVYSKANVFGRFDLLLIDEAHRIPLKGEGRYREFVASCRKFNPALRVVGLTATPYRLQGQAVPVCGPGNVLDEIAYEARITDLIADGYLSPLVSKAGSEMPDLSAVRVKGGEYDEKELGAAMLAHGLVPRTVADLLLRAHGRRAGIVFCVTVAHAQAVLDELHRLGETAALVHGGTPKGERAKKIGEFQSGALRWIVNVNVLSEGFDAPHIDCVAMLRPTKSPGLYYQQVGRGFRMAPGKVDCLVLDYAGNMLEHGPVDAIRVAPARPKKPAKVETGRAKECPRCAALLAFGVRVCPECGYQFASPDPQHSDRALDGIVLSTERVPPAVFDVTRVSYARHDKPGKTPSLRVSYHCGLRTFREWVCVEHLGLAGQKAVRWFAERGVPVCPRTVDAALALSESLPVPVRITVDESGKYPEIIRHEFAATECGGEGPNAGELASRRDGGAEPAGSAPVQRVRGVPEWLVRAVEADGAGRRAA